MIVLGLSLLLVGWLTGLGVLATLGEILLVIGVILLLLGYVGHPIGGRTWWF